MHKVIHASVRLMYLAGTVLALITGYTLVSPPKQAQAASCYTGACGFFDGENCYVGGGCATNHGCGCTCDYGNITAYCTGNYQE